MNIENLPEKYQAIWDRGIPYFKEGRSGDLEHAKQTVEFILNYKGNLKMNLDILIPVAMMHDIGHAYILPEHFKYLTGGKKLKNGKLTHMLTGAKIAYTILNEVGYDKKKIDQIIDIISTHDADQIDGWGVQSYDTEIKKIFNDIDKLDRFSQKRIDSFKSMFKGDELEKVIHKSLDVLFFDEFKQLARKRLEKLKFN